MGPVYSSLKNLEKKRNVGGLAILLFLLSVKAFAATPEAAYRKSLQDIVRLNKECSKLDKAILAERHFTLADKQLPLTAQDEGRRLVLLLKDERGQTYLFKQSYSAKIEEVAGFLFRLGGVILPANYTISLRLNGEEVPGSLQTFLPNEEILKETMLPSLPSRDIEYIQRQQVLDWLCSNFEVQFLRNKNTGTITGIDKDDAFWGVGLKEGRLSVKDMFGRGYGTRVYERFWQLVKEGVLRVDLGVFFGMIDFLQDIDDEIIIEQVRELLAEEFIARHFILQKSRFDAVPKEINEFIKKAGGFDFLNKADRTALMEWARRSGMFDRSDKEYLELVLARKKTLRTDFAGFYSTLAEARGDVFAAPTGDAKFDYAASVKRYLKKEVAQRKAKLAFFTRNGKKEKKDIRVLTSLLGRHLLIHYANGKQSLEETISALERLSANIESPEEAIAVTVYLLILKSDKVFDKIGLLNLTVVMDPARWNAARMKNLYEECRGTAAAAEDPGLRRLLELRNILNDT